MKKINNGKKSNVPLFIQNLYSMVEEHQHQQIVRWGSKIGSFEILDASEFCERVLPKYFNHRNLETFVRQLYNYDFKKIRIEHSDHCYYHKNFSNKNVEELKKIKRKKYQKMQDSEQQDYQAFQSDIEEISSFRDKQNQFSKYIQFSLLKLSKMQKQNVELMNALVKDRNHNKLLENVLEHFDEVGHLLAIRQLQRQSIYRYTKSQLQQLIAQSPKLSYLSSKYPQNKKQYPQLLTESSSNESRKLNIEKVIDKNNLTKLFKQFSTASDQQK